MRVWIRKDGRGEYPSLNFGVAAMGFREMGWELAFYVDPRHVESVREDVVVDFVDPMRTAFGRFGAVVEDVCYPPELESFLGRKVWASTVDAIANHPENWGVFIKPRRTKTFTGRVASDVRDFRGCREPERDTEIWCSEPLKFVAEWRCFLRYGRVLDVRPYAGTWRAHFDPAVVERAVAAYTTAPAGCAMDFGVTEDGRTLLIEVNDGYALGAYGLHHLAYAKLLSARWSEVVGVEDPCDF